MKLHVLKNLKHKLYNFDIFELGNSVILYYLVIFFFAPILVFLGISEPRYGSSLNYHALLYLLIGLLLFIAGYFSKLPSFIIRKAPNIFQSEWNFKRVPWIFGVMFSAGLLAKFVKFFAGGYFFSGKDIAFIKGPFYSAIGFLGWFSYIALAIAFISYYALKRKGDERYKMWRFVAWGTLVFELIYALPTCMKMNVLFPVMLFLVIRWYMEKKSWALVIFAGLVIVLILFPFANVCRSPQVLQRYSVVDESTGEINLSQAANSITKGFVGRMNQYDVFAKTLETQETFLYGKPFLKFFVSLGPPRFIWKDKPIITPDGNEFGRRIGVLKPYDFETSVGATVVGDLYMNFGLPGIILGMFLMGVLFRIFFEYLIKGTNYSFSGILIYSIVWVRLMKGMENTIAPVYAGLVKIVVVLIVLHFLLVSKSKQ